MRVLLTLSYLGTRYCGWQMQQNGPSIQAEVEKALFLSTGEHIRITGSSRTDAGVHALCQRAHFDTLSPIPPERYPFVLNRFLPPDIRVLCGQRVPEDFHARFQAKEKTYTYRIHNSPHASAIYGGITCHVPQNLDAEKMNLSAQALLGRHDFCAFAAAGGSAKTTEREMTAASVSRTGERITFVITGSGFLYNMVRIIAGTLIYVGQGKLDSGCISRAITSGCRTDLGITAPPEGLELTRVAYDAHWQILP